MQLNKVYNFLGIIVIPTLAITVSIFSEFFSAEQTIPRGIIMLFSFLFIVTVAYFVYTNQQHSQRLKDQYEQAIELKDKTIEEKDNRIQRLENDIRDHTKGLWREFGSLNALKKNELLLELFQKFSKNYSSIIAIQLYNFFEQRDNDETFFKIEHTLSHVMESQDLNSLQQHYYRLPTELIKRFENALYIYRGKAEERDTELLDMYKDISGKLSKLTESKVTMQNAIEFAFLILIRDILGEEEPNKEKYSIINNDPVEKELFHLARTGILRGILYDKMFYHFNYIKTNHSHNNKSKRAYLTVKSGMTNGQRSILVVTIDNEGKEIDMGSLGEELFDLLIENGFN